ncbi:unnamed protein product [Auanema sp. JU1783]|nr:unnamed protein product [Auanema sp. JU1783]
MKFIKQFAILLMFIVTISSAFLLPPPNIKLGELKKQKPLDSTLIACGGSFCLPENCNEYCDQNGETTFECE